ncbi:hypothetical protein V8E55_011550 [Tylopilus felleus]
MSVSKGFIQVVAIRFTALQKALQFRFYLWRVVGLPDERDYFSDLPRKIHRTRKAMKCHELFTLGDGQGIDHWNAPTYPDSHVQWTTLGSTGKAIFTGKSLVFLDPMIFTKVYVLPVGYYSFRVAPILLIPSFDVIIPATAFASIEWRIVNQMGKAKAPHSSPALAFPIGYDGPRKPHCGKGIFAYGCLDPCFADIRTHRN